MNVIAMRYAESLFDLAKEEKAVETYQKDITMVQDIFQDDSIVKFFSHVSLADEVKINVLKQNLKDHISLYTYHFLLLLIQRRRIRYIRDICQQFQSLCYDDLGIKVGKVYSPYALDAMQLEKIEKAMSIKEGTEVQLRVIVDEDLIGGVKVEIENHIYDDSLSHKLESLKQELLRR